LVKALPRPSKTYGETVCCAGVTSKREWKRLYPVRFRFLSADKRFKRWERIKFKYRIPTHDRRVESCHIFEDKIDFTGTIAPQSRFALLCPMIVSSASLAAANGASLAIIRPTDTRFAYKKKTDSAIESETRAYRDASRQAGFLDKDLAEFKPSSYRFAFSFRDSDGKHTWQCGDWETHAAFLKWRGLYGESEALRKPSGLYNDDYPKRGVVFAIGNMANRPHTWQLLGVIRLDATGQLDLI
jgi:hypothetical protein